MWSTTDTALRQRLVVERGGTDERFAAWLGRLWAGVLVQPDR